MHFRIYYEQKGDHVHSRWFAGQGRDYTHGKCGDLCMRADEWNAFLNLIKPTLQIELIDRTEGAEHGHAPV